MNTEPLPSLSCHTTFKRLGWGDAFWAELPDLFVLSALRQERVLMLCIRLRPLETNETETRPLQAPLPVHLSCRDNVRLVLHSESSTSASSNVPDEIPVVFNAVCISGGIERGTLLNLQSELPVIRVALPQQIPVLPTK